eukprot:gene21713-25897_t
MAAVLRHGPLARAGSPLADKEFILIVVRHRGASGVAGGDRRQQVAGG